MGGAAISTNSTGPSARTVSVSNTVIVLGEPGGARSRP